MFILFQQYVMEQICTFNLTAFIHHLDSCYQTVEFYTK